MKIKKSFGAETSSDQRKTTVLKSMVDYRRTFGAGHGRCAPGLLSRTKFLLQIVIYQGITTGNIFEDFGNNLVQIKKAGQFFSCKPQKSKIKKFIENYFICMKLLSTVTIKY